MGAGNKQALRVTFDSRLKLEDHGSKATSYAGLLACRELDETTAGTGPPGRSRTTQRRLTELISQR
jgi:hypothetical protein